MKKYTLTIEYNEDTEEIEYISEEIVGEESVFEYGDIVLDDYFDQETLDLLKDAYIVGDS